MYLYNIIYRTLRICFYCVLSLAVLFSIVGFRDSTSEEIKKDGVKCTFKARIIETVTDPKGRGLVVIKKYDIKKGSRRGDKGEKTEGTAKRIYVLVTDKTEIGYTADGGKKISINFNDLKIDMSVVIEGTSVLQKVDDQEIIIVWAKSIEPVE